MNPNGENFHKCQFGYTFLDSITLHEPNQNFQMLNIKFPELCLDFNSFYRKISKYFESIRTNM